MWGVGAGGVPIAPPGGAYGMPPLQMASAAIPLQPSTAAGGSSNTQKNDIFVGNLAFNTTEEQLHQAFSEIGRVLNVRLVTDIETGKPRGFAFVEFEDPQAALSAIRNMNDYELNGRRLRVNFSNSSHLEVLAGKLGMDLSQQTQRSTTGATAKATPASAGTSVVADALKSFSKAEAYDVIAKLKETADRDPDEARRLISSHPQLPEALLFLMSNKLDMVKTPIATNEAVLPTAAAVVPVAPLTTRAADPRARADPRMAASTATTATATATTTTATAAAAARVDPRQRAGAMMDPRMAGVKQEPQPPPPPVMARQPQAPPPPPPPPSHMQPPPVGGYVNHAPHLDPTLVQQVMSLTPQQIQQLPPDKQQSILQLRQQITGGHGM